MYSQRISKELKDRNIGIGDRIRVTGPNGTFEGLLMPRPDYGDQDLLIIKLDSGYNVGVKVSSIELLSKAPAREKKQETPEKPSKGDIVILGCGGTIASKLEYTTGAVYPSITPRELRISFPALGHWPIHSRQLFTLLSEDMNTHHWKVLAEEVEKEIGNGAAGVVIMHGTDTMTYTSAILSFMLQHLPVPVVFVGAQRSSDRPSSENQMNLLNSVFAATQDVGEVGVCMHASSSDDYCHLHRGTRVRKMHTSRRDAFRSINSLPLASVDYRSKTFKPLSEIRPRKGPLEAHNKINDNVALIYSHPNIKPEFVKKLDSYDGVVFIGTGLGHVPTGAFDDKHIKSICKPIGELVDSGIPVVMSSQCIEGRICMRVYTTGRLLMEAGVIGDGADWTPETAYAKLCWVLGQTKDMKKVREMMMKDYVGEISHRSAVETG